VVQHLRGRGAAARAGDGRVLFYFAKFLQAVGFADVSLSLLVGFVRPEGAAKEVLFVTGVALFWGGRVLERRAAG
jgi:hypothetical protein